MVVESEECSPGLILNEGGIGALFNMRKAKLNVVESVVEPSLTPIEIVRAATNDPALSENEFELGGKVYKVVDLSYKSYITFFALLAPLLEALFGKLSGSVGLSVGAESFSKLTPSSVVTYCLDSLPRMAQLVCQATDPDITIEEIEEMGKTPFKLAEIVMLQVARNKVIEQATSFFETLLPLMKIANK